MYKTKILKHSFNESRTGCTRKDHAMLTNFVTQTKDKFVFPFVRQWKEISLQSIINVQFTNIT